MKFYAEGRSTFATRCSHTLPTFILASLIALTSLTTVHAAGALPNYDVPIHGTGKYLATPAGKIYYEIEGSGAPIFLVSGGPGSSHAKFHPLFSLFAKNHTVVYFDNLGRGRSDRLKNPRDYTVERDADDIEALRKALSFNTITVIGHSYGGMPALAYALKYPDNMHKLVLASSPLNARLWQAQNDNSNAYLKTHFPEIWAKMAALSAHGIKSSATEYAALNGLPQLDRSWFNPANAKQQFRSGNPVDGGNDDVYLAMLGDDPELVIGGTMRGYDPLPQVKRLSVPTLICVGRHDYVVPPVAGFELKSGFPDGVAQLVVFEKSGHRPWVEEMDLYAKTIATFLDGAKELAAK